MLLREYRQFYCKKSNKIADVIFTELSGRLIYEPFIGFERFDSCRMELMATFLKSMHRQYDILHRGYLIFMSKKLYLNIISKGSEAWNNWVENNPGKKDLSSVNLSKARLKKVDFHNVNLSRANLSKADLSKAKLDDTKLLFANLEGANLRNASLIMAKLSGSRLVGAKLINAMLIMADFSKANLSSANLSKATLWETNFSECNLTEASLTGMRSKYMGTTFSNSNLRNANLSGASLTGVDFTGAVLGKADLTEANLTGANLSKADLTEANLTRANLSKADLTEANLTGASLSKADLTEANLTKTKFSDADLSNATLNYARLVETNFNKANLSNCEVYGISAWGIELQDAKQLDLIITPPHEPIITIDNLEVAQFIYLLLHNEKIRGVIDTITSKVVLILGSFTSKRKPILDAIRDELRRCNYLPILFDFQKPVSRSMTETISTLAHMSRFIIADITAPKSVPQELQRIIPDLPSVPVQPLLQASAKEYGMFMDYRDYPWVQATYKYHNVKELVYSLKEKILVSLEEKTIKVSD